MGKFKIQYNFNASIVVEVMHLKREDALPKMQI